MPRKTPQQRAIRVENLLKGRDLDSLPKYVMREVEFLAEDLGISAEKFLSYKPSTRAKYIRAAKRGQTATDMRRREQSRRAVRKEQEEIAYHGDPQNDRQWAEVIRLRDAIRSHGLNTTKGEFTRTDKLDQYDLLSDESLVRHIIVYRFPYVLNNLRKMLANIQRDPAPRRKAGRAARTRWMKKYGDKMARDFAATSDYDDERWFWYHTGPTLYYGPVKSTSDVFGFPK